MGKQLARKGRTDDEAQKDARRHNGFVLGVWGETVKVRCVVCGGVQAWIFLFCVPYSGGGDVDDGEFLAACT